MLHLTCTPEGVFAIDGEADTAVEKRVVQAGGQGTGELLVCLATEALAAPLEPGLAWARDFARMFFARLCQTKDPMASWRAHGARIPMIPGAEYVSNDEDAKSVYTWCPHHPPESAAIPFKALILIGSGGRARTYDLVVNSHPLYR